MENRLFVVAGEGKEQANQVVSTDLTQIEQQLASINSALWALVAVLAPQAQAQAAAAGQTVAPVAPATPAPPAAPAGGPVARSFEGDWRSAVPAELYERLRARRLDAVQAALPTLTAQVSNQIAVAAGKLAERLSAAEQSAAAAHAAALPAGYQPPFLPSPGSANRDPAPGSPALPAAATTEPEQNDSMPAFRGLDWRTDDRSGRLLVSVKPVADAALAAQVAAELAAAPGFSSVRPLGATGDVAAYEVHYEGELPRGLAVSQALKSLGASLVAGGDREFYLAIEGQLVH